MSDWHIKHIESGQKEAHNNKFISEKKWRAAFKKARPRKSPSSSYTATPKENI